MASFVIIADRQKQRMRHIRFHRRVACETETASCEVPVRKMLRKDALGFAGGIF